MNITDVLWEIFRTNYGGDLSLVFLVLLVFFCVIVPIMKKANAPGRFVFVVMCIMFATISKFLPDTIVGLGMDLHRIKVDPAPYKMGTVDAICMFSMLIHLVLGLFVIIRKPKWLDEIDNKGGQGR